MYNPDGSFRLHIGQEGDQAEQINLSTGILAISPKNHLLIGEAYRVEVSDSDGNHLVRSFTFDYQLAGGSMRDVAVNVKGYLFFISSGGKVLEFDMNYP